MTKELIKVENPLAVPEHLRDIKGHEGLENVRREDLVLPRLAIAQSTSKQLKPTSPLYIEKLKMGDLFNTVTGDVYGSSVLLIPLIYTASRILFKDLDEGGGILCRSFNGRDGGVLSPTCDTCENSKFTKDEKGQNQAPACTNFMNFPSLLPEFNNNLIAASWKSTALKPASTWLTRMQMANKPMFAAVYEVRSNPDKNAFGDFYVPTFTLKRWTTADEFTFAKKEYEGLKGRAIKTDESEADEAPAASEHVPF